MEQNSTVKSKLILSNLPKTWIIDIDGTILKHNGHLMSGGDTLLDKSIEFLNSLPGDDMVVLITSRSLKYRDTTIDFLKANNIRYNHIIFEAPVGERILINDKKQSGLLTAFAVNLQRDEGICCDIQIDLFK